MSHERQTQTRAIAYIRVTPTNTNSAGAATIPQLARCRAAANRGGLRVVATFLDLAAASRRPKTED